MTHKSPGASNVATYSLYIGYVLAYCIFPTDNMMGSCQNSKRPVYVAIARQLPHDNKSMVDIGPLIIASRQVSVATSHINLKVVISFQEMFVVYSFSIFTKVQRHFH